MDFIQFSFSALTLTVLGWRFLREKHVKSHITIRWPNYKPLSRANALRNTATCSLKRRFEIAAAGILAYP